MKLRNYILIAFVKSESSITIKDDLLELANTPPRYICTKDYTLASFSSTFEPLEIRNFLNQIEGRMFFIFDSNDTVAASNLPKQMREHLFQNFEMINEESPTLNNFVNDKNSLNIKTLSGSSESIVINVEELSTAKRMEMLNDLFDKGLENLNNEDRELLDILSKKS